VKNRLLWLIPLAVLILFGILIAALPSLVASTTNRATIEALASSLTGRSVHIGGSLSLNLVPEPQLIAERITIGGPDHEIITAQSLTLDIALTALLRGRLSASNLSLQSPDIALPWPLPGGAAAIAPPPWLTTLHAQIAGGRISVGALRFTGVDADIYTGAGGSLSIAGTGILRGQPIGVSLSVAGLDAAGSAPVTMDAQAGPASMHLAGTFNAASALSGTISVNTAPIDSLGAIGQAASANAAIDADPEQIDLTKIQAFQGDARLAGTATLALGNPILSLNLTGTSLNLPGLGDVAAWTAPAIPIYLSLSASESTLAGEPVPHLAMRAELSAAGADISALSATLPGNSSLSLSGTADPAGHIAGDIGIDSDDFSSLLAAFGAPVAAPDAWRQTSLTAKLGGTLQAMQFRRISGTLGPGYVTGTVLLDRRNAPARLAGALHFNTLDLTEFDTAAGWLPGIAQKPDTPDADFEITADRATYQRVTMSHLLIDAELGRQLVVRRLSAALYGGFLAASFTIAPTGDVSAARAVMSLPSAAPLAAFLPAADQPPAKVMAPRLAAAVEAAGPPTALATSASLTLGDFSLTASPVLDLAGGTAKGPVTLRHPSAIAAVSLFGLNAGIAWPGAGSLSMRADMTLSRTQFALPDFVVSFGDLTADGTISVTADHQINGDIAAATLALPPPPAGLTPFWTALSGASGKILVSANRVLVAGTPLLGQTSGSIALQPNSDNFSITHAQFAGGTLAADMTATTAPATPPSLEGKVSLTAADPSQIALPFAFPLTIPTGTISLQANLTAAGYSPPAWAATLAGTASLAAKSGTLAGFSLQGAGDALTAIPRDPALTSACLSGASRFDTLSVAGNFDHGIYSLTAASLQSPAGSVTATGSIDVPDQDLSLNLSLLPNVPAPPPIGLALDGPWAKPQKTTATRDALAWTAVDSGK
jgi:hypothetical protein